jgi:hypothetical protein
MKRILPPSLLLFSAVSISSAETVSASSQNVDSTFNYGRGQIMSPDIVAIFPRIAGRRRSLQTFARDLMSGLVPITLCTSPGVF